MSKLNPHPLENIRVALVERVDLPGHLGAWCSGGRLVCPLPAGYDGRTSICYSEGYIIVAHPDLPPLLCDPISGTTRLIEPGHVEARDGRMRLLH